MDDLILLVADKNMRFSLQGALSRPDALNIRVVSFKILVHSSKDSGCRTTGSQLLALERRHYSHALLVMDFDGSGTNKSNGVELEDELDRQLAISWGASAKAIVIEPELDVWLWGSDNALSQVLGHPHNSAIRPWLQERGFSFSAAGKPHQPKEAMEFLLRELRKPRSSDTYEKIAGKISLKRCLDPAFLRLRDTLRGWFPV